jgi:hypothetical protein
MTRFYAPEGSVERRGLVLAPMAVAGPALRIGVLDNHKDNALLLLSQTAKRVASRFGATASYVAHKPNAAIPAEEAVLARLADEVDLVLTGSAD